MRLPLTPDPAAVQPETLHRRAPAEGRGSLSDGRPSRPWSTGGFLPPDLWDESGRIKREEPAAASKETHASAQSRDAEREPHQAPVGSASAEHGVGRVARSVAGASDPLPHGDVIQAAFGHHDVSGIRTQTGAAAGDAAQQMGATAFATGDKVGFVRPPDLHTAAHEAAHVVQQRGGVQLKGGVGQAGDSYERHADAVADRVVRGESAARLLDQVARDHRASSVASATTPAIQAGPDPAVHDHGGRLRELAGGAPHGGQTGNGEPPARPSAELNAFVAAAKAAGITFDPHHVVLDPEDAAAPQVSATIASTVGPPGDQPYIDVRWTVLDPGTETLWRDTTAWYAGQTEAMATSFSPTLTGPHKVHAELVHGGAVIAHLEGELEVEGPTSDRADEPESEAGIAPVPGREAVAAMSEQEIAGESRAVRGRLAAVEPPASGAPMSAEHRTLVDTEAALDVGAAERGIRPPPLPDPGAESVPLSIFSEPLGGAPLSAHDAPVAPDPAYAREHLERVIAQHGWDGAKSLVEYAEYVADARAWPSEEQFGDLIERIAPVYRQQLVILEVERKTLIAEFGPRARSLTSGILKESEERVGDAIMRYGLVREDLTRGPQGQAQRPAPGQPWAAYQMDDNEHARALARAAGELADARRELDDLRARRADLKRAAQAAAVPPRAVQDEQASDAPSPEMEQYSLVQEMLAEATRDWQELRAEQEAAFPILAVARRGDDLDLKTLDVLASGDTKGMSGAIGSRVFHAQDSIQTATLALASGRMNVWRQPEIVRLTKDQMSVAPGSARERWIDEQVAVERPGWFEQYGLAALSTILALVAALPSGGTSVVAGAAVVVAAGVDTYLALEAIENYRMESAMAGSDYDKARALSQDEPSLFWVAVEVVAAATGVAGAVKPAVQLSRAFDRIVAARKAVLAAGRGGGAGNLVERLEKLRAAARAAHVPEESVERLVRETAEEVGDDAIESAGRRGGQADDALDHADDAARAPGGARSGGETAGVSDEVADEAREVERIPAPRREPPTGKRREKLLDERGSDAETLTSRPGGWTASKEAEWRGYPEPPQGNEWWWSGTDIQLRLKAGARRAGVDKYHYDGFEFVKVPDDDVLRARFRDRESWSPRPSDRRRLDRFVHSRQRSQAMKQMESDPARATNAARRMTRASESLGEEAAARWVKAHYPEAVPLHGWPPKGTPGAQGEFDQIWKVPKGAGPDRDLFLVIEGKGARAELGTAKVGGIEVEQGTREYFDRTAAMMEVAGKPGAKELQMAAPDQVRYIEVKVPVSERRGGHQVGDIVVSDFDAP